MRTFAYTLLLVMIGVGAVSCCAACRGGKSIPVNGTQWGLIEMNGKVIDRESTTTPDRLTLILGEDGRISGAGDCNRYFAPYTLGSDGSIRISNIGSTRMMCPNPELESSYFKMLENATKYKIDGDFLILSNNENQIIGSFKRM